MKRMVVTGSTQEEMNTVYYRFYCSSGNVKKGSIPENYCRFWSEKK